MIAAEEAATRWCNYKNASKISDNGKYADLFTKLFYIALCYILLFIAALFFCTILGFLFFFLFFSSILQFHTFLCTNQNRWIEIHHGQIQWDECRFHLGCWEATCDQILTFARILKVSWKFAHPEWSFISFRFCKLIFLWIWRLLMTISADL